MKNIEVHESFLLKQIYYQTVWKLEPFGQVLTKKEVRGLLIPTEMNETQSLLLVLFGYFETLQIKWLTKEFSVKMDVRYNGILWVDHDLLNKRRNYI